MQLVGTGKYITHKTAGTAGTNSRTWTFDWTAPGIGAGDVTFYGAFLITNSGNNSSGDTTVLSSLAVSECTVPPKPVAISGNTIICTASVQTYSVDTVDAATGYIWQFPPGWAAITMQSNTMDVITGPVGGRIIVWAMNDCGVSDTVRLDVFIDLITVSASSTDTSASSSWAPSLPNNLIECAASLNNVGIAPF